MIIYDTENEVIIEDFTKLSKILGKNYTGVAISSSGVALGLKDDNTFEELPERFALFVGVGGE